MKAAALKLGGCGLDSCVARAMCQPLIRTGIFSGLRNWARPWLDQPDSGAVSRRLQETLRLQPECQHRRRLDPFKKHIARTLKEHGAGAGLLGRVGRAGAAPHHPAAAKITEASKKLEMKKLRQALIKIDDYAK